MMTTDIAEKDYWDAVFSREDPWDYSNDYEQKKYGQRLSAAHGINNGQPSVSNSDIWLQTTV